MTENGNGTKVTIAVIGVKLDNLHDDVKALAIVNQNQNQELAEMKEQIFVGEDSLVNKVAINTRFRKFVQKNLSIIWGVLISAMIGGGIRYFIFT